MIFCWVLIFIPFYNLLNGINFLFEVDLQRVTPVDLLSFKCSVDKLHSLYIAGSKVDIFWGGGEGGDED